MAGPSLYQQVLDYTNRANPYPLYAEMRKTPVARQDDGSYVVSTYQEITALLHDPRISSDLRKRTEAGEAPAGGDQAYGPAAQESAGGAAATGDTSASAGPPGPAIPPSFLVLDPPEHDRLRRLAMRQFGPPNKPGRVDGMRGDFDGMVKGLIDGLRDKKQIDIVDDFASPFPVTVISDLLGVPHEDEARFHGWADEIIAGLDPNRPQATTEGDERHDAQLELAQYMAGLM
ncbi:MAG: cytochrome P450, partial [Dehalococcoidia bacterium]